MFKMRIVCVSRLISGGSINARRGATCQRATVRWGCRTDPRGPRPPSEAEASVCPKARTPRPGEDLGSGRAVPERGDDGPLLSWRVYGRVPLLLFLVSGKSSPSSDRFRNAVLCA